MRQKNAKNFQSNQQRRESPSGPSTSNTKLLGNKDYDDILDDIVTRLSSDDDHPQHHKDAKTISENEQQPLLSSDSSQSFEQNRSSSRTRMNSKKFKSNKHPSKTANDDANDPSRECLAPSVPTRSAFIYLVTILSAIGGFLFGYDTGIVSGAMLFIRDDFKLNEMWQEIVVSATILAAWIFSLIAGYLSNRFGRKWVIIIASFVFTIGGLMMALATTKYLLLVGRFTVGAAIGLASMVIPVYIAEVAPVQIRGTLVTINTCFVTFGQFVAALIAVMFAKTDEGWRYMLGIASVPSLIQFVCFFFLPESPRWLIQKNHYDQAYQSLRKFRGPKATVAMIDQEFDEIKDNCVASQRTEPSANVWRILRSAPIRRALFIGCLLMMYQQLAGINTVMYYSATIIQMSGVYDNSVAVWLAALTAFINFIFSFVGMAMVERIGRRLLTLLSLFGVVLALIMLGVGFQLSDHNTPAIGFHTPDQSSCSLSDTCEQCISSSCGFCFYSGSSPPQNQTSKDLFSSFVKSSFGHSEINGTCLMVNKSNEDRSNDSILCTNGTAEGIVWTTKWCPSNYSMLILAGLMLYLVFFAPGMGPMPWTINSEIYPLWARSFCYSASTSVNWFFNLLVSLTFLSLSKALTSSGAYFLYAGIAFSGWLLFLIFLPETKGRTLEEIEILFEQPLLKMRKTGTLSVANARSGNSTNSNVPTNTTITNWSE